MLASTDRSSCPRRNTGTIAFRGGNTYSGRHDELLIAYIQRHSPVSSRELVRSQSEEQNTCTPHTHCCLSRRSATAWEQNLLPCGNKICYRVETKSATAWEQNLLPSGNKICYRVGTKSATAREQKKVGLKIRSFSVALRPPRPYGLFRDG